MPLRPALFPLLLAAAFATTTTTTTAAAAAGSRLAALSRLKAEIHTLSPEEANARLASLASSGGPPPPRQDKIDHFVVLFMENQAADVFAGCMDLPGLDSLRNATIPKDPSNPGGGSYTFKCYKEYICMEGPEYDPAEAARAADGTDDVVEVFGPEQIPIKVSVAKQFAYFNRLYSSVPAASSPNHLFAQTATSCGIVSNIPYDACGGSQPFFPPFSIYDSLTLHNVPFFIYYNTTCNTTGDPGDPDHTSCFGPSSPEPTRGGVVSQYYGPDVNINGVWRYREKFASHERFYDAAATGTLPQFSWIAPSEQASDHPCNDIRKGERQLKDIYEALRAGPKWNKTLLLVVYDDYGGAYDHVIPPAEWRTMDHMGKPRKGKAVPADEAPCHVRDQCDTGPYWNFTSLGLRTTAMLISPWVEKGAVYQEPKGPTNTSQFELSSIPSTIHNLFNLSMFLTKRDKWAGAFDELLLDKPRPDADCPMHLPDAPRPAHPWTPAPPLGGKLASSSSPSPFPSAPSPSLSSSSSSSSSSFSSSHPPPSPLSLELHNDDDDNGDKDGRSAAGGEPKAQHCGREDGVCRGADRESVHQRRRMEWLALRTGVAAPAEELTHGGAHAWLSERWEHGLRLGHAPLQAESYTP